MKFVIYSKNLVVFRKNLMGDIFLMEIPSTVDYKNIKKKLEELETQETICYAEFCLADGHRQ